MSWKDSAQRWLREPLLHFALIGLAIFMAYGWRNPVDPESRTITITAAQVDALAAEWAQGWNRAPTPAEIDMLIREDIKDEIYTREAQRLGLLHGDTVVRKRMRGRMEFIATSQADAVDPTDAQLQALLDKDAARYRLPPRLSFDQVYLGGSQADAAAVLARLPGGADPATLGDQGLLPRGLDAADAETIRATFGEGFAAAVAALPVGQWSGPVESGVGWHVVRLRKSVPSATPTLAQVRQRVENDWRAANRRNAEAAAYQALLDGYTIKIESPGRIEKPQG